MANVDIVTLSVTAATLFAGSDVELYFSNKANDLKTLATGVEGENFNFDLRFYRQAYTVADVSGYHVWASLSASIDQLTLINADAIKGSIGQAEILLNVASEGAVVSGVDIPDAVVLREAPAFAAATAEFASVTGTAALIFQEKSERIAGSGVFTYTDVAYFAGGLTLTKTTADVTLPSTDTVFGDLLVFELQNASAFIGVGVELPSVLIAPADIEFDITNAEGVLATDFNFTLGLFKTQATATDASVIYGGVSFTTAAQAFGLPQTELIARELSVKLNAASDLSTALDWTQVALQNPAGASYLDLSFDGIELLANVEIAIADTVSIAGTMELSVKTQTIDDGAITAVDATVVTFKLSDGFFAAGTTAYVFDVDGTLISEPFTRDTVDGPPTGVTAAFQGFYASGVGYELAIIARNSADLAGPETWLGFRATVGAIDVVGLGAPGSINIDGRDFLVTGNFASTALTPTIMNWKNLADDLTGPQLDLTDATLGLNGLEQFKIGGTLTLEVPGAAYLTSTFTMAVVADAEATAVGAVTGDLLLLTLSETTFFGGSGAQFGDDAFGNRVIERGNAAGVYVENAGLAFGVLIDQGSDPAVVDDDITYIGLTGGFDLAQLLGLDNVEAQANDVSLKVNIALDALGNEVAKLDWSTINYLDASTALGDLDSGIDFALGGSLYYGDGFVYLGGGFTIATGGYTVSGGGTTADFIANVTTFTVSDAALFAGVGGGFTYDAANPTVITGLIALADLEGATGFDASGVSAELAFVIEEAGSLRSWSAVDVSVATADLAGLPDGFVASASNLSFRTNVTDVVSGTKLDWTTLTLDATAFDVVTGLTQVGAIDTTLNVAFGGSFRGEIDNSVLLAGTLSGEIVTLDTLDALPGDVAAGENVNVMRFSVNSGYIFAGVGGSFTETDGVVDGIAAGGTGFAGQNLYLDLLSISQGQSDPTIQATTQNWTALSEVVLFFRTVLRLG